MTAVMENRYSLACRKSFPGEKWLDLHIHEVHDVLIKIRRERGEKTYQCFVEGCDRLCSTPVKRRRHLIDKHHYPKWFNFDLVLTGVIPFNERMRQLHKEQALWKSRAQPRQQQINDVQKSDHHQQQHRRKKDHNLNEKGIAGSMDIETHSLTVNGASRKPQSSSIELSLPSSSTPSKCGLTRVNIITTGLVPKTKAFRQYRSPQTNMAATVRQRDVVMHDQDMATDIIHTSAAKNIAAPVPITTAITMHGSEDKIDMEIDSLQKSMARLMIPRSVANKMRSSNQK
ncbi:hypothetical protein BX616_009603 [Lobosporangium transversale]|nr:hypothetical protein BX616_009603 [Lobosporangium transversale]